MIIDPLQQALDQLRALSQPQAPVGQPQVPAVPRLNGPDFTGQYTSLPSADEREQILAQDGLGDLFAPPSRDYYVPDPTPEPALTPEQEQNARTDFTSGLNMTTPESPRTVEQGTAMVDEQLARTARARAVADAAKGAAAKAHAEGMAAAADRGVEEQTKLMGSHQRTLDAINASADMETANWLSNMSELAKQEPNPGRWWDNQGGLGKALWALSLVFGSGYAAITPGAKNAALQMVQEEINRDMQLQANRLKQQMAVEEMRGSVMKDRHARNRSDEQDKYGQQLGRVMALQRAWEARSQVPGALDDQAAIAESKAWFEAQKLPLFESRRGESVAARSAAAQRAHQTALRQLEINAANDRQEKELNYRSVHDAIEDQRARDLAQIAISAKGPRFDQKGRPVDEHGIPVLREAQSGVGRSVIVVDPVTKKPVTDGVARFRDDTSLKEFEGVKKTADERYRDLTRLHQLMNDKSRLAVVGGTVVGELNPEIETILKRLGYTTAKALDPRGIVTNADLANGIIVNTGFNADGNTLDRAKLAANWDKVRDLVGREAERMKEPTENTLSGLLDKSINSDAKVLWQPTALDSPKVPMRSEKDILDEESVSVKDKPVAGVSDYRRRAQAEADDPNRVGMELPDHDPASVQAVISAAEDDRGKVARSPDAIRAETNRVLAHLEKQEKALQGRAAGITGAVRGHTQLSEDELATLKRIENTKAIVQSVGNDEILRAAKTLKHIESFVKATPFGSEEWHREQIKRKFGMAGAPKEVDAVIAKVRKSIDDGTYTLSPIDTEE